VRLFSPDSDDPPRVLGTREPPVLAIAFAPDGGRLIALRRDSVVVDLETGETIAGIANPGPGEISAAAWSPDGRTLAIGESDGSVLLLDAATGKPLATWRGHRGPVLCLAFSPRGRRVISGSEDTTGLVWPVPAR
jgi:WD40 repeat protein